MKGKEGELELTVGTLTRPTMISFPSRTMVWYLTMRLSEGTGVAARGKGEVSGLKREGPAKGRGGKEEEEEVEGGLTGCQVRVQAVWK